MIKSYTKVEPLRISIDTKLTFDHDVSEICRKAAGQLNALKRLSSYLTFNARKVLADAFIFSNFSYCLIMIYLVWYFSTAKQLQKIEKIQAGALRFIHDYESSYDDLRIKSETVTMEVKRMRSLCIEIYKTLNDLNQQYMNKIFALNISLYSSRRPYNLRVPRINKYNFGLRSIRGA